MGGKAEEVIFGRRMVPDHEPMSGFVEGQVWSVGPAGMTFIVKDWDNGKHKFGPSPWPKVWNTQFTTTNVSLHTHDATATEQQPVKGDRCLVVFTDNGPWVIGWWPK